MNNDIKQSVDLETAQGLILENCSVLPTETLSLSKSLNRYPAEPLAALESLPGYDQSLRDGYAIGGQIRGRGNCFTIVDEVAAGDTRDLSLAEGEAVRIMTGGLIPKNTLAVVPEELCSVAGDTVETESLFPRLVNSFVHRKGCELARGALIVSQGSALRAEQLILLAGVGYDSVSLVRRPRISFFCTGSELVSGSDEKCAGKKYSANSHLLHGLITLAGAELQSQSMVRDDPDAVLKAFAGMSQSGCDIIISTGGMGPGKFDLVEDAFLRAGGKVVYSSLQLRPGKSTLFGILGDALFFGMPGPPPAVHLLFNELIRPAILALQGAKLCRPQKIEAYLTESLHISKHGLARLKSGLLSFEGGRCLVHSSNRVDMSNCYIYCPAAGGALACGDRVTVHMTGSLPCFD